jgi:putative ABC transport system ATP-binding protein
MGKEALLKTEGLSKSYHMGEIEVRALRSVDVEIYAGEFIVLLGQSGSGKSTLLNLIGGLDHPTSGRMWYRGQRIDQLTDSQLTAFRRDHIGFIFQMYNLIPRLTAEENVQLVTDISPDPMKPKDALEIVGLGDRLHHFPAQLSGGEQQRVAIARAIAKQPKLLFCDEPTGALDLKTGILVLDAIQKINATLGTTTLVISHNTTIAKMANRVISLKDGEIDKIEYNTNQSKASDLLW